MKKLIGYCGVDSGSILIADPCYVMPEKEELQDPEKVKKFVDEHKDYNHIFDEQLHKEDPNWRNQAGEVLLTGIQGTGVLSHTFHGDGNYPVFADLDENGKVRSLTIEFV